MAQAKKEIEYAPFKDGGDHPYPITDVNLPYSECYNGNVLVKKAFAKTDLTQEHISEIIKCSNDPLYFIETYCRIISLDDGVIPFKLFQFQKDLIKNFQENRMNLALLSRQAGKCFFRNTFVTIKNKYTGDVRNNINFVDFYDEQNINNKNKIQESNDGKFIRVINLDKDEWEIESDSGWSSISNIMKTISFERYILTLENGFTLECADDHIVFLNNKSEIFVKDLNNSHLVSTKLGPSRVVSVVATGLYDNMYDIEVNTTSHAYYSNGILSHNTQVVAGYLTWFSIFNPAEQIAILANKADAAQEIMDRIRFMIENLPFFIQPGVKIYNRRTIVLDTDTKLFSSATGASGIRGRSCVVGDSIITIKDKINGEISNIKINELMDKIIG